MILSWLINIIIHWKKFKNFFFDHSEGRVFWEKKFLKKFENKPPPSLGKRGFIFYWTYQLVRLRSLHYWGIIHSIFFCWIFCPLQFRWLLHECYISLLAYISITTLLFLNAHIRFLDLSSFSFCSKSGAISTKSSADDALEALLLSLASLISLLVSSGLNE